MWHTNSMDKSIADNLILQVMAEMERSGKYGEQEGLSSYLTALSLDYDVMDEKVTRRRLKELGVALT